MYTYLAILKENVNKEDNSIVDFCSTHNIKIIQFYKILGILKISSEHKLKIDIENDFFDALELERNDFSISNEEE